MKKTFILTSMLLVFAAMTQAQSLNGFFEKYADDERFSYTKIGKNMQTLTLEINNANKALAESIEKEVLDIMKKDNFELEVASREKGERSYIYSRPKTNNQGETVIINRDKSEINILWTLDKGKKGFLNMNDLQGLQSLQNLQGLEGLSDLKNLEKLKDLKNLPDLEELKKLDLNKIQIPDLQNFDKKTEIKGLEGFHSNQNSEALTRLQGFANIGDTKNLDGSKEMKELMAIEKTQQKIHKN